MQMSDDGKRPGVDDMSAIRRPTGFDTDGDGMSDKFEVEPGLGPCDPANRNGDKLIKDEYTNLEVYLNGLAPDKKLQSYLRSE